jgi:hypothetical protein
MICNKFQLIIWIHFVTGCFSEKASHGKLRHSVFDIMKFKLFAAQGLVALVVSVVVNALQLLLECLHLCCLCRQLFPERLHI